MKESKSTKRALAASIGCMALCVAMLVGTTFAWFTDTATTNVNSIQAGTLDVELLNADDQNIEGETLSFVTKDGRPATDVLWEPGCTYELPAVYVKNNGTLALKYKIEITGIQGDATLNDAIEWTITDGTETNKLDADHALAAGAKSGALTIKGHMKESAGNTYQGLSIEGVTITVVATQQTAEFDSYSDQYDKDAVYPAVASIVNAKASGDLNATGETTISDSSSAVTATIPEGAVESGKTVALTVDRTAMTADSVTFDINFLVDNEKTSSVMKPIIATVNIGKGLQNVAVTHNGTPMTESDSRADQTYSYDAATGILTIVTSSFSPFTIDYKTDFEASINGIGYATFVDALSSVKEGDTIKLSKDVTIDKPYSVDNRLKLDVANVTIDLNGKTLSSPNYTVEIWGENDVLKNGTVIAKNGGSYSIVPKGKNVTIDSVTSIGGISVSGYNGNDVMSGISATITNCNITSGPTYYAVCSQGEASTYVENSTLIGKGGAIFWIEKAGTDQYGSWGDASLSYKNVTMQGCDVVYSTVGLEPKCLD